jgi:hypothetical protein
MRGELKSAPFLFLSLDNYFSTFAENTGNLAVTHPFRFDPHYYPANQRIMNNSARC